MAPFIPGVLITDIADYWYVAEDRIVRDPAILKRIVGVALRQVHEVENLDRCTPHSFISCVLEAATLGLEIGINGECWMIPYETPRRSGSFVAQLQIGYLGHLALAWRSEKIAGLQCDVVCDGDFFEYQKGTDGFIRHRPKDGRLPSRHNITHVYAVLKTIYGGEIWDVYDVTQIEQIRQAAPSGDSPAWVDHYGAMARGKMLKQVVKFAPKSREQATAVSLEERLSQTFTRDVSAFTSIPARTTRGATIDEARGEAPARDPEPAKPREAEAQPAAKAATASASGAPANTSPGGGATGPTSGAPTKATQSKLGW